MPTWTSTAKWSVPARLFILADELPKSKIASVLFIVFVSVDTFAPAGDVAGEVYFRKLSVIGKSGDAVVDRAVGFVGTTVFDELRDDLDHLRNVFGGARCDLWAFHSERVEVFPKITNIRCGKIIDRHSHFFRFVYYSVVNVRQVKNVRHAVSFVFQIPPQDVAENESTEIADMSEIPHRWAADVHPHLAGFQRFEGFHLSR